MGLTNAILSPYNEGVTDSLFESMKQYLSFGPVDEENVRDLGGVLIAEIPGVVDAFCDALAADEEAIAILTEGPAQIIRLQMAMDGVGFSPGVIDGR